MIQCKAKNIKNRKYQLQNLTLLANNFALYRTREFEEENVLLNNKYHPTEEQSTVW